MSSISGKRFISFLEKINLSSDITSKTPPDEGIIVSDSISFLYVLKRCSANSMAFGT